MGILTIKVNVITRPSPFIHLYHSATSQELSSAITTFHLIIAGRNSNYAQDIKPSHWSWNGYFPLLNNTLLGTDIFCLWQNSIFLNYFTLFNIPEFSSGKKILVPEVHRFVKMQQREQCNNTILWILYCNETDWTNLALVLYLTKPCWTSRNSDTLIIWPNWGTVNIM